MLELELVTLRGRFTFAADEDGPDESEVFRDFSSTTLDILANLRTWAEDEWMADLTKGRIQSSTRLYRC